LLARAALRRRALKLERVAVIPAGARRAPGRAEGPPEDRLRVGTIQNKPLLLGGPG
jgi:hypothetical protein